MKLMKVCFRIRGDFEICICVPFRIKMLDSPSIVRLYENVLIEDMRRFEVTEDEVLIGIESMAHVYKPDVVSLNSFRSIVADYNDVTHRCAYLHKYAAFHTAMVRDMLSEAIHADYNFFHNLLFSENSFRICSLGGGPGSDVIGALAAFYRAYPPFDVSATVVDYMVNWSYSFNSIMNELSTGWYGSFGTYASSMPWQYYGANLLKSLTPEVFEVLSSASLVTMVKFASAAACQDTEHMMKNIFAAMKPGAVVLFIDNDGGGFHNIFNAAAMECGFFSVYGPFRHINYVNENTKIKKFGRISCFKSTITVHMLQKPFDRYSPCEPFYSPFIRNPTRRVLIESPFSGMPSSQHVSPPTPMLYCNDLNENYTRDDYLNSPQFISPTELPLTPRPVPSYVATPLHSDIVNSPLNSGPSTYTPNTQRRRKKKKVNRKGCLPFNHFRHHLAKKVENVKARARSLFQKRKKDKAHPIFRL